MFGRLWAKWADFISLVITGVFSDIHKFTGIRLPGFSTSVVFHEGRKPEAGSFVIWVTRNINFYFDFFEISMWLYAYFMLHPEQVWKYFYDVYYKIEWRPNFIWLPVVLHLNYLPKWARHMKCMTSVLDPHPLSFKYFDDRVRYSLIC